MSKKTTIIISLLLVISAIIIEILLKGSKTNLDIELVEFFAGILFGTGVGLPIQLFFGKNKK